MCDEGLVADCGAGGWHGSAAWDCFVRLLHVAIVCNCDAAYPVVHERAHRKCATEGQLELAVGQWTAAAKSMEGKADGPSIQIWCETARVKSRDCVRLKLYVSVENKEQPHQTRAVHQLPTTRLHKQTSCTPCQGKQT